MEAHFLSEKLHQRKMMTEKMKQLKKIQGGCPNNLSKMILDGENNGSFVSKPFRDIFCEQSSERVGCNKKQFNYFAAANHKKNLS